MFRSALLVVLMLNVWNCSSAGMCSTGLLQPSLGETRKLVRCLRDGGGDFSIKSGKARRKPVSEIEPSKLIDQAGFLLVQKEREYADGFSAKACYGSLGELSQRSISSFSTDFLSRLARVSRCWKRWFGVLSRPIAHQRSLLLP